MTSNAKPSAPVSRTRRILAAMALLALLVQVGMFFFGFMVPFNRAASLWGKSLEDRRGVVWGLGKVLKGIADQLPPDARIYIMYPDHGFYINCKYYFYPRHVGITTTGKVYQTGQDFAAWNEEPTVQWLQLNGFSHVINCKEGRMWKVPEMSHGR